MKIDEETALDDSLPEEQVYAIGLYVENRQDTLAEHCSADFSADCSADCSADQEHFVAAIKKRYSHLPLFAEIANFLATEKKPVEFTGNEKRKFLRDAKLCFWDEPSSHSYIDTARMECSDDAFRTLRFQGSYITAMVPLMPDTLQLSRLSPRSCKPVSGGPQCSAMLKPSSPSAIHANDKGTSARGMRCLRISYSRLRCSTVGE